MGDTHSARVDVAALDAVAGRVDEVGILAERAARTRLTFDGASAGRVHAVDGDALRRGLEGLLTDLDRWARAAGEISTALRVGARRYRDADHDAAGGLGR